MWSAVSCSSLISNWLALVWALRWTIHTTLSVIRAEGFVEVTCATGVWCLRHSNSTTFTNDGRLTQTSFFEQVTTHQVRFGIVLMQIRKHYHCCWFDKDQKICAVYQQLVTVCTFRLCWFLQHQMFYHLNILRYFRYLRRNALNWGSEKCHCKTSQ